MSKENVTWILYDSLAKTQSNPISTEEVQMAIFKMRQQDTERFYIWTAGWENWLSLKAYLDTKQTNFVVSFNNPRPSYSDEPTVKNFERDVVPMKKADPKTSDEITKSFSNATLKAFSEISLQDDDFLKNDHTFDKQQFDGDDIKISEIKKPSVDFAALNKKNELDRRADRHKLQIKVLLISPKGKTFRSASKNISLTGTLLEDNIPFDYCGVIFDIVIINKQPCDPKLQRVPLRGKTVGEGLTQRLFYVDITPQQKMNLQKLLENYVIGKGKLASTKKVA
jgi:hypothetical protein